MAQATGLESESRSWRESLPCNNVDRPESAVPEPVPTTTRPRSRAIPVVGGQRRNAQLLQLQLDQSNLESAAADAARQFFDTPDDQWCVRKGWIYTDAEGREHVTVSSTAPPVVILQYVHGRYGEPLDGWPQQPSRYDR